MGELNDMPGYDDMPEVTVDIPPEVTVDIPPEVIVAIPVGMDIPEIPEENG